MSMVLLVVRVHPVSTFYIMTNPIEETTGTAQTRCTRLRDGLAVNKDYVITVVVVI